MTTESTKKLDPTKETEEPKVGTDEQIEGNGAPTPPTNSPNGQIEGNSVPTGQQ